MLTVNRKILYHDVRKNLFTLDDVKKFLQDLKNQQYLQRLLLDKNYCENSDICKIMESINKVRVENDANQLKISNHWVDYSYLVT